MKNTVKNYLPEIILASSFLFFVFAMLYSWQYPLMIKEEAKELSQKVSQSSSIALLKQKWDPKKASGAISIIENMLSKGKKVTFDKKGNSVNFLVTDLDMQASENILNKILNSSLQIKKLKVILQKEEKYSIGCECSW
ncbi:MAG: hypothetical protein P8Y49_04835 [Sulfurovaceae bacterium]